MPRLRVAGVGRRVEQQAALEEGDAAPVLHGAAEAARDRDEVELGQRIGDAEIVVVIAQQLDRGVERIAAVLALAARRDDADRDAGGVGGDALEVAGREHEQVARHRAASSGRRRASVPSPAGSSRATGMLETARNSCGTVTVSAKLALKAGSSQPGKMRRASAGSSWLDIIRLRSAGGRIIDKEQAAAEAVDAAGVRQAQLVAAGRDRAREAERRGLVGRIERNLRRGRPRRRSRPVGS